MNEDLQKKTALERRNSQIKEREEILWLSPEQALDRILSHQRPEALIQSFPEEDFYFLIHDIGLEDSLTLLSMASSAQWEYILDIESWEKDRMDIPAVTKWLNLFLQAAPKRLIKWFLQDKAEFFEFYLFKNIEVAVREHDQDPSDLGTDFFTLDDTYYVKIIEDPENHNSLSRMGKVRQDVLPRLLELVADFDHILYQQILVETRGILPAESEEEAYRLRNVRLAEKGFLPFDEALGIYRHLSPQRLRNRQPKIIKAGTEPGFSPPASLSPTSMMKMSGIFSTSLRLLADYELRQQIQAEFAALCNQIIAADQKIIRDRKELRNVVKKVCGYLSIGLDSLAEPQASSARCKKASAEYLTKFALSDLFRVGYGSAIELKWRAEKWRKRSWYSSKGLPLTFWGESWTGVLGGLLIKKPLFFDNYKSGVIYREFASIADIKETESVLDEIIAFDDLFSLMTIPLKPISTHGVLHYKNLIFTLWARHSLRLSAAVRSLTIDEFRYFFKELWVDDTIPRKVKISTKTSFLEWITEQTGLAAPEVNLRLGKTFEKLFDELESEYGYVSKQDLDPKYIYLFLLK